MTDDITAISLRGVRKLIEDKSIGESVLDAVDNVLGLVIVLSPAALGPAALPLLALIEPKNELVKVTKGAIKAITKSTASDYLDQAARLAAADCLLTYTAYFDALGQLLPDLVTLTEQDKRRLAEVAAIAPPSAGDLADKAIPVPHPAALDVARAVRTDLYQRMSAGMRILLVGLDNWERLDAAARQQAEAVLTERVPVLACSLYEAEYLGMAVDFPRFFVWSVLRDQRAKDELIKTVGADLRTQFELVASALGAVDLGLGNLAAAIRQLPAPATGPSFRAGFGAVAEALHLVHEDAIGEPVINDQYADGRPRLVYPAKAASYVPQAYRVARYTDKTAHLESEDQWDALPAHDDLGPFLVRHLESPYSIETPLLILGHPGSGKSLLTSVIAARLAYPRYTTVRVELRDVNPDADPQSQIEAQVRRDTGRDINWADFAGSLTMSPPVVILDGYDELLQATGKLFAGYLEEVRRFQHREAVQRRPVRVLVTSRITLIDKAIVPPGTTIVRLEKFDQERRQAWIDVWNTHNGGYFQQAGVRPFRLPASDSIVQLAEQPLLLLMLALYDSGANQLSSRPDIDQTVLYHELLARFIEREQTKDAAFAALPQAARTATLDKEMERLGVAAIGMFNRQDVKIRREELDADLGYFEAEPSAVADGTRRMSKADLLLGSFFFIHESRSRLGPGLAAFEFLHNTFGEFLAADFIARKVIGQANAICAVSGDPALDGMLRQQLLMLSPDWFACLAHAPLHTRPNILAMLREWGRHRLAHATRSAPDLLAALDKIVVAQLGALLTQISLPDLGTSRETPYQPLPALGQLAVYSLNLVLLRCYLADGMYSLDEAEFGGWPGGCRPWDRLTALWRSWFPLESLGALATVLAATRVETRVLVAGAESAAAVPDQSSLHLAYNIGQALADDLAAVTAGLHVATVMIVPESFLAGLREKAEAAAPALVPVVDTMVPRLFGGALHEPPDFLENVPVERLFTAKHPRVPGYVLGYMELADRMMITPRQRGRLSVGASDLRSFLTLSRYEAELAVQARDKLEPRWLPALLNQPPDDPEPIIADTWRIFLLSPAAAPPLRAATRRLSRDQCAVIAAHLVKAVPSGAIGTFDIDTAAALAVLSWRGREPGLCARSLDTIIRECEAGAWHPLDIPVETWDGLADLFVSGDPPIARRRDRFGAVAGRAVQATQRERADYRRRWADLEVWIQALRICVGGLRDAILAKVIRILSTLGGVERGYFLLLMRWAHENRDHGLVHELFAPSRGFQICWEPLFGGDMATLDVEEVSPELTHRETLDLSWVLDVLRQPAGGIRRK